MRAEDLEGQRRSDVIHRNNSDPLKFAIVSTAGVVQLLNQVRELGPICIRRFNEAPMRVTRSKESR